MESGPISTKPLTREESKILLNFVEGSKIINNKATNATTNKMKNEEWQRIANQFNAVVTSCHRTPQQLRLKWENLKKNSRKRNTLIRMNNIKTGGGGPDYIPPDEVLDRVAALLGNTVDGLTVSYGGDAEIKPDCLVSAKVAVADDESDVDFEKQILTSEPISVPPRDEILKELNDAENSEESSTSKPNKISLTPRASGFKRKLVNKSDDNRAARNQALANYYNVKTKLLELNMENVLLENKKLKLEIEKLQSNRNSSL